MDNIKKVFPALDEKTHSDLANMLCDRVVGRNICHVRNYSTPDDHVIYNGRIEKLEKKSSIYVVAYWKETESYEDAVDYYMPKYQLAADVISGDLILL